MVLSILPMAAFALEISPKVVPCDHSVTPTVRHNYETIQTGTSVDKKYHKYWTVSTYYCSICGITSVDTTNKVNQVHDHNARQTLVASGSEEGEDFWTYDCKCLKCGTNYYRTDWSYGASVYH